MVAGDCAQSHALGREPSKRLSSRWPLKPMPRRSRLAAPSNAIAGYRRPKAPLQPVWPTVTRQQYERDRKHADLSYRTLAPAAFKSARQAVRVRPVLPSHLSAEWSERRGQCRILPYVKPSLTVRH